MEIKINEQTQRFYLAFEDEWKGVIGHEIKVGKHRFCAIPADGVINISEVTTGMKAMNITVDLTILFMTETKEDFIKYLYTVGERLKKVIERDIDFDKKLEFSKTIAIGRLGEMPPIKNVDLEKVNT